MEINLEKVELLLLVAAVVAIVAQRLRMPYTAGLVITGFLLPLFSIEAELPLTRQLVFNALLPPLIFEAAFNIHWRSLRPELGIVSLLATVGVAIAAVVTAVGMHFLAGWSWGAAWLFGVLIAATDPVSVISTFKEVGLGGRTKMLVEAESLFNDGTAAVAFTIALAVVQSQAPGVAWAFGALLTNVTLGLLCGAAVGYIAILIVGHTEDHLLEITFTTLAAYGSFWMAEHLHLSGVLATLAAGLVVGNRGRLGMLTDRGREAVEAFWEYAAFAANSIIFLLIGIGISRQTFHAAVGAVLAGIIVVTAGRAFSVYPLCSLFARSKHRVSIAQQHILFWGGLRGALALGLALGLPPELPERAAIITVAFAVAAFSIIVQGATIRPLIRHLGIKEVVAPDAA